MCSGTKLTFNLKHMIRIGRINCALSDAKAINGVSMCAVNHDSSERPKLYSINCLGFLRDPGARRISRSQLRNSLFGDDRRSTLTAPSSASASEGACKLSFKSPSSRGSATL